MLTIGRQELFETSPDVLVVAQTAGGYDVLYAQSVTSRLCFAFTSHGIVQSTLTYYSMPRAQERLELLSSHPQDLGDMRVEHRFHGRAVISSDSERSGGSADLQINVGFDLYRDAAAHDRLEGQTSGISSSCPPEALFRCLELMCKLLDQPLSRRSKRVRCSLQVSDAFDLMVVPYI
jgi:hypothetical protein